MLVGNFTCVTPKKKILNYLSKQLMLVVWKFITGHWLDNRLSLLQFDSTLFSFVTLHVICWFSAPLTGLPIPFDVALNESQSKELYLQVKCIKYCCWWHSNKQTNISNKLLKIPTGGRLTSWLFTQSGRGTTENKSRYRQGGRVEPGNSRLQIQHPKPFGHVIVNYPYQRWREEWLSL